MRWRFSAASSPHQARRRRSQGVDPRTTRAACIGFRDRYLRCRSSSTSICHFDWTGRQLRAASQGAIPAQLAPILERLGIVARRLDRHGAALRSPVQDSRRLTRCAGVPRCTQGKAWLTGPAATRARNSPLGSLHWSVSPPLTYTGRGAHSAINMCWSTGNSSQRPAHFWRLPANCQGKFCAMSSSVSPQSRRIRRRPFRRRRPRTGCHTFVLSTGPEDCLAQARDAGDGDPLRVDGRVALQIVNRPADAPRPGADGPPFVGSGPRPRLLAASVHWPRVHSPTGDGLQRCRPTVKLAPLGTTTMTEHHQPE